MGICYEGTFGEIKLTFRFKHSDTPKYFGDWLHPADCMDPVFVPEHDYHYFEEKWDMPDSAYTEYSLSAYRACDELLKYKRCVFHGAAFLWKGKAYIFTAKSGTGKSTQLTHWLTLFPDEICVMNGDKPVLACMDGNILVFPSPWKGKERMGDDRITAALGGIILLEQGKKNSIRRMHLRESVISLLQRILFPAETEESVRLAAGMLTDILASIPVWKLVNDGTPDSAILTHTALDEELAYGLQIT